MFGSTIGLLNVTYAFTDSANNAPQAGFSVSGNQGNQWIQGFLPISTPYTSFIVSTHLHPLHSPTPFQSNSTSLPLYKHCSKILQETLLNSVSNDLRPCMVGQSHDSFTLLSAKDARLFQHCQWAIQVLCTEYRQEIFLSKPECQVTRFCVFVSE
jgi:hypothetical protein